MSDIDNPDGTALTEILARPVTDQEYRDRATGMANMLASRPERHSQGMWVMKKPSNECGTVACIAGWAALALNGRVQIATDGTMTWNPAQVSPERGLWDPGLSLVNHNFQETGQAWLGLSPRAAASLFYLMDDRFVVEILRRVGDGRLSRDITSGDLDLIKAQMG